MTAHEMLLFVLLSVTIYAAVAYHHIVFAATCRTYVLLHTAE